MIAATVSRLGELRGARRLLLAFVAGAFATLALPPFHIIPALWLAFPLLLWMLDGTSSWRTAATIGWAFGFGHFLTGLYWIGIAFTVDSETFGVFAVPAVAALCAGFGIFTAIVCALTQLIPPAHVDLMPDDRTVIIAARAALFAAAWMLVEWLRSWIFTGFPWNLMATVWAEESTPIGAAMMQSASIYGAFGLSLVTVAAAAMASVLGHAPRLKTAWLTAGAPLFVLAVIAGGGAARLASSDEILSGIKLRLVQPNIAQADKWRPSLREAHLQDHVQMSLDHRPGDVTHVIWSEAAIAFVLDRDEPRRRIAALAAPPDGLLITGGPRVVTDEQGRNRFYNSLLAITPEAEITAIYDKHHLVPFGEYTPLAGIIPFGALTGGALDADGGFLSGTGPATLNLNGLPPFSPLICYEAIFPAEVVAGGEPRPAWMLNLTNDAWFGMSTGPYQHLAAARLRAVEQGLPLVRVAGTGISAVVDPHGRVAARLDLGARGVIDAPLPKALTAPTFYGLAGNIIPLVLAAVTILGAGLVWRRRREPN